MDLCEQPHLGARHGIYYAVAQHLFRNGVYHRCIFELRVNWHERIHTKNKGGAQWTFPTEDVFMAGVWIVHNTGKPAGPEHLRFWDPEHEAIPFGCRQIREDRTPKTWQ